MLIGENTIQDNLNSIKVVNNTCFLNCVSEQSVRARTNTDSQRSCPPRGPDDYLYPCPYIMPPWDKHIFITKLLPCGLIINSGFLKHGHFYINFSCMQRKEIRIKYK